MYLLALLRRKERRKRSWNQSQKESQGRLKGSCIKLRHLFIQYPTRLSSEMLSRCRVLTSASAIFSILNALVSCRVRIILSLRWYSYVCWWQVSDIRIVVALDQSDSNGEDLDLPERCRILKLANSVTYDRSVWLALSYTKIIIKPGWTKYWINWRSLSYRTPMRYVLWLALYLDT